MEVKETILVVDDEVQIRRLLEITLTANGYNVHEAASAKDALVAAAMHTPALIILDLGLPDTDGQLLLLKLREWYQKPVIILSARSGEEEIIRALDSGANDYLTKPFRNGELLARIRSCIRISQSKQTTPVLSFGSIAIDMVAHTVKRNGVLLKLTSTEFSMLAYLAGNAGKVITHQQLLKEVWGNSYAEQTQNLRVFIAQLRKKIEDNPSKPMLIQTESGIGYRFAESNLPL